MRKSFYSILIALLFGAGLFSASAASDQGDKGSDTTVHHEEHHEDHAHGSDSMPGHHQEDDAETHDEDHHGEHEAHHYDDHGAHHGDHHSMECHPEEYDASSAGKIAVHHISDANIYSIGPWNIPLPCIVYVKGEGLKAFSSGRFDPGHHGIAHKAVDRFTVFHHKLMRVNDPEFPVGSVDIECFGHHTEVVNGKEREVITLKYHGKEYALEARSTLDGGILGGGMTSFYDFSLTKNVVSMIFCFAFLAWLFLTVAKAYKKREGMAPKGLQSFMEPMFLFIQEEVSKPILGVKWQKYQPFLMALFFFILVLNLFGQIPFLGNSNVTGNISVTIALALFTMVIVNFSGNRHYWQHIFWMPGVPAFVKFILTPVEVLGVFLKPLTLFVRLFGNISAGHMVIVIFVSLIFIFGEAGENLAGGITGMAMAIPLTMFMMALELLVALLQAFVFTILTAVYIGAAIEEHH